FVTWRSAFRSARAKDYPREIMKIDNGTGGSRETSTGGSGSRSGRSAVDERGRESMNFFAELKRRNVYKVAVAYAVVGWLVIQVTATIVPALHLPDGLTTAVVVLTLVGFPVALVIAWAFEMTPEGMKRTENVSPDEVIPQWSKKKLATLIIGVAVIAAGLLAFQLLRSSRSTVTATANAKSIAVLPFVNMSADKNDEYLSDGMTEELINVLAKVPGLRVPGRTSCFAFKGKNEEDIFRKV